MRVLHPCSKYIDFIHYLRCKYQVIPIELSGDQFSWKVLGAALKKIGRISESLVASQKAVEINPQDIEAHNNLGNTLQELGKLDLGDWSLHRILSVPVGGLEGRQQVVPIR